MRDDRDREAIHLPSRQLPATDPIGAHTAAIQLATATNELNIAKLLFILILL